MTRKIYERRAARSGKTLLLLLLLAVALLPLASCGRREQTGQPEAPTLGKTLNVYNWFNYIDKEVIRDFEREFGVKVNYDTYASNEELLAKLMTGVGGYDVIVPSDYMVEIMIKEGLLAPLDLNNIPNLKNIDERFLDLPFDPGNLYTVPYMWGTVGIGVNTRYIQEDVSSWRALFDPSYQGRITMLNDKRETFGVALKLLGHSINTTDPEILEEAKEKLLAQKPLLKAYDSENIKHLLVSGEAWLVHAWSGDVLMAAAENPDIVYVLPKEGGVVWADNLAIPKEAPNKYTAEVFINYLLRPEVSARLTRYIQYGNPNREAWPLLEAEFRENPAIFPTEESLANSEWLRTIGEATTLYDRLWTEVKGR
ncbi:MAG: spermidine/putrescine ABC transporter substrate-binding protein [Dethiobacter sp.]|nr:spermidine/putrescine ABC transporter substrate-binding protein [Dethiobacter sp.]